MFRYDLDIDKIIRNQYWIYIPFTIAPLIYLLVSHLLTRYGSIQANSSNDIIFTIIPIIAAVCAIGGVLMRKFKYSSPMIVSKSTFAGDFAANSLTNMVIYCAFFESIAVYGLVMVILGDDPSHIYYYVAASLILFIIFRPTRSFLEKAAARQEELVNQERFYVPKKDPFKWG